MEDIHAILEAISVCLASENPSVLKLLQPGLSREEIEAQTKKLPFKLPESVFELYSWRNGTTEAQTSYDEMSFFPGYYLLPLDRAIEIYQSLQSGRAWKKRLFPVFKSSGGDYDGILCEPQQAVDGPIFRYMQGDTELRPRVPSLAKLLTFVLECFQTGVYVRSEEGGLAVDRPRQKELLQKYK